ncbi:hypothetical protein BGW41_004830 [Actinomortierella wolfii]|nr:hypothetical protein BGW41_004830 [Actinomortierella wolfii]
MANIPDRFHYSSVMPLTEANLYKHTIKNPPSREEKLKFVLSYVDQQCDLVIQEQQAYLNWIDTTRWSQDPNNLRLGLVDRQDFYQPSSPTRLSLLDPHPDFSGTFVPTRLKKTTAETTPTPAWDATTRDQGQAPSSNTNPGRPKSPTAPTRPQRRQRLHQSPLQQQSSLADQHFDSHSPTTPAPAPWLQSPTRQQQQQQQHNHRQNPHVQHDQDNDPYRYTNFGLNGLDPSVALPRALPRSMMRTRPLDNSPPLESQTPRDSFQSGYTPVVDEWSRLDDPSSGLSDPYLYSSFPSPKRQSNHQQQNLEARSRQVSPLPQHHPNTFVNNPSHQQLSEDSSKPKSKASRWMARFSLMSKRHQRHESLPAVISDPWTTPSDKNAPESHQRFHSMTHRSGAEMAAELATGPGSKAASNQSGSRVKRLFQGVFQKRSSKDAKGSNDPYHQFQELSGENESEQRSNRARSPLGDHPYFLQHSTSQQRSQQPPSVTQQQQQQQQQQPSPPKQDTPLSSSPIQSLQVSNSPRRQSVVLQVSAPMSLSNDGLNESLVDPLQQMPMLEKDDIQDTESIDSPYRPASLTPPPPSSVMRHSNVIGQSLNNASSTVYIHGGGNGDGASNGNGTQTHSKNRRPSSQILPPAFAKGEPLGNSSESYLNSRRSIFEQGPTMVAITQMQKADLEGLQQNAGLGLPMFVGKTA